MPEKIAQRNRKYKKRLLYITPISLLIILSLFITSDYVPYTEIEKRLGWKGALRVLPEITIIPDSDPYETFVQKKRLEAVTSLDLSVIDETGEAEGRTKETKKKEEKNKITPIEDGLDMIFAEPKHTSIPYSEDYIILKMVNPEYPEEELSNGIEGEVTLEVLVNEEGRVENAWTLSLIGPKSFERSSLRAIRQFIFQPPFREGKPVPMSIRFQINFKIL